MLGENINKDVLVTQNNIFEKLIDDNIAIVVLSKILDNIISNRSLS